MTSTALTAPVQTSISLRSALTANRMAQLIEEQGLLDELIRKYLKENVDFGVIPGTKKPTLYKAGAEKVTQAYECQAVFKVLEQEIDHDRLVTWTKRGKKGAKYGGDSLGLYRFVIKCELVHRATGIVVAEGYGAASTMESKYIDRPRECENTVLKMSKKRSHVDAVLGGFGLSERFTQDVEDTGLVSAEDHDAGATVEEETTLEPGTLAWAQAYEIPLQVQKSVSTTAPTLGKAKGKELQLIVDSCIAVVKKNPQRLAVKELGDAAQIVLDGLEEERLERERLGGGLAAPAAAPDPVAPEVAAPAAPPATLPEPQADLTTAGPPAQPEPPAPDSPDESGHKPPF